MRRDYFSPEDCKDQQYDFESSGKDEVATQEDETEDVEILKTSEGGGSIDRPLTCAPATGEAPVEATATEIICFRVAPSRTIPGNMADSQVIPTEVATAEVPSVEITAEIATTGGYSY